MRVFHVLVFVAFYLWEMTLSTIRIACLVMRPRLSLQSRFVEVPIDLRGDLPRFLFACLVTMTPGSMSVGLDSRRNVLIVHLIDAADEAAAIEEIKSSFELPLIRIFGAAPSTHQ